MTTDSTTDEALLTAWESSASRCSSRDQRQAEERAMRAVVQNPLPGHHVLRVPFVVAAGVEIAIVFREASGGDGHAEPMACWYHAGREPQIDVVLVGLSG